MRRSRYIFLSVILLVSSTLACIIPDSWVNIIGRLPTPTPTPSPGPSGTWYVSKDGNDSLDCLSTSTACLTINAAVAKAHAGDQIIIGPGTFEENDPASDVALIILNKDVALHGNGSSGPSATLISGYRVTDALTVSGTARVSIDNIIIANGGGRGSGLYVTSNDHPNVTLLNSVIQNNAGPGVHILGNGSVTLENVTIRANAGGIEMAGTGSDSGNVAVRNSRIVENNGPGINNHSGRLNVSNTTIDGNSAASAGGGITNWQEGNATIELSTISRNSSGIYNAGMMTLTNSTVSTNQQGSGIWNPLGSLTLLHVTIADNLGTGLYGGRAHLIIEDSLFSNGGADCAIVEAGTFGSIEWRGHNLDSDESCVRYSSSDRTTHDLQIGPLVNNGGSTLTHALLPGSPAIDTATGICPGTDQRGVARPLERCDVGAYEYVLQPATTSVIVPAPPRPTGTPVPTAAPITAPTLTLEQGPQVTFLSNANCRKGPGPAYDVATSFAKGKLLPAVGRNEASSWWLVQIQPGSTCWVGDAVVSKSGPVEQLPVMQAPPLPEAPAKFVNTNICDVKLKKLTVNLNWATVSGATGYNLYRNGSLLTSFGPGTTTYVDNAPLGVALTYAVEALNGVGHSGRVTTTVPLCK
jgi:Right handed beta helix region